MSAWAGLTLFPLVGLIMISTGMPAFLALLAASGMGAALAVAQGNGALLGAVPARLIGLLESDLVQALPLFVLMGALINRMALVDILFRSGRRIAGGGPAAGQIAALTLGALMAPMNGSVGASVTALSRGVRPLLARDGASATERVALIAAAGTLGVAVPPSLVLIFLGDAMMSAHTIAANATGRSEQIINTQDIFRAALVPTALVLVCWLLIVALRAGKTPARDGIEHPAPPRDLILAGFTTSLILALLIGVASGLFYAVEAAAMGCVALLLGGVASRALDRPRLSEALKETLAISGALFALLIAATTFTLVLRMLGADLLVSAAIAALPGDQVVALGAVLMLLAMTALVLDAFEIVFVVIPIVMPGLLMRVPDAAWSAALTVLVLQASFLFPPFGYAIMMARGAEPERISTGTLAGALAPFLAGFLLVGAATLTFPVLTHLLDSPVPEASAPRGDADIRKAFDELPAPPELPPLLLQDED